MIVLRAILGGVIGLIAGTIITVLLAILVLKSMGIADARDSAIQIGPIGGLIGMGTGATWLVLRRDKKA